MQALHLSRHSVQVIPSLVEQAISDRVHLLQLAELPTHSRQLRLLLAKLLQLLVGKCQLLL